MFATEDGTIAALDRRYECRRKVDHSSSGAIYKGLALANAAVGTTAASRLYATNFSQGTVEVFDQNFAPVTLTPEAFTDKRLPSGYAPFGIANIGGGLVVTYTLAGS